MRLVIAAMLAATGSAAAEAPASATLRWIAPAGCPDEGAVRARVDARLAKPLGAGDSIDATVTVRRERKQLRAHVVVWTPAADADRELVARRCDELADAVAVVLARAVAEARALIVTAEAAELLAITVPPPPDPIERARPIEPRPRVEPDDRPPRRRVHERNRRDGGVRPSIVSSAGLGPRVGFGVELGVWFVWDSFAGEVVATRWIERLAALPASQRFGAAIGIDAIAGRACWNPARYGPRVCFLGETGTMSGRGVGLFEPRVGDATYTAAGLGVSLRARVRDHVALVAGFDMMSTVIRPRFVLDRGTVLHQPDPIAGRVGLGFELGWR